VGNTESIQSSKGKLLVTGASGFIAGHCILDLLDHGYEVRGTVRNMARAADLRSHLLAHSKLASNIEFVEAELTDAGCWDQAVDGCNGVFHIASPVPTILPKSPERLVAQAKNGAVNVIEAASRAGIKRIVVTSSILAVTDTEKVKERTYISTDWADPMDPKLNSYALSKTLSEKAAWNLADKNNLEMAVVNPGMVLGPALEPDYGSSLEAVNKFLTGAVPMIPKIGYDIVDVRDVATLHRIAYENSEAVNQRLLCGAGFRWFSEIAELLRKEFPDYEKKIARREMPLSLTHIFALFIREMTSFNNDLNVVRKMDCSPAIQLGWKPRSPEVAIIDGARSLINLGVV
jgi:dihydroflavonol-4-reductase